MTTPEWTDDEWRETALAAIALVRNYRDPANADSAVWQLLGEPLDRGRILLGPRMMRAVITHLIVMVVELGEQMPERLTALLDDLFAQSLESDAGSSG